MTKHKLISGTPLNNWFVSYHAVGFVNRALETRCKERVSDMLLCMVESSVVSPSPINVRAFELTVWDEQRTNLR
jgi:hypothetical protein